MILVIVALYLAGMTPTWAIAQASSIIHRNDVIIGKWLNSLIIIAWPIIGLLTLPALFTFLKK